MKWSAVSRIDLIAIGLESGGRLSVEVIPAPWRLFIAAELSTKATAELLDRQRALRRWTRSGDVRCSNRQSLHLTLRFIGDLQPDRIDDLKSAMAAVAEQSRSVGMRLGPNGCFPGPRTPRVLWAGLEGDTQRLGALASQLRGATTRIGVPDMARRFFPHITLARVRIGMQRWVLQDIGGTWTVETGPGADVHVGELTLFRSHLKRGLPPRYEKLFTAKLAD